MQCYNNNFHLGIEELLKEYHKYIMLFTIMEARFLAVCSGHFNSVHFVIYFLYNLHVHVLIAGQFC